MGELDIFAIRIKQLRESLKMTQKEFSGHIGIKQQTLSGYERGLMKPPLDVAKGISEKHYSTTLQRHGTLLPFYCPH